MTAADDREVTPGPCGDRAPLYGDGPPLFCDLRAGHAGWHEGGEHRTSWTYHAQPTPDTPDALAAAEARGVERGYRRAVDRLRTDAAEGAEESHHDVVCLGAPWAPCTCDRSMWAKAADYLEAVEGDDR